MQVSDSQPFEIVPHCAPIWSQLVVGVQPHDEAPEELVAGVAELAAEQVTWHSEAEGHQAQNLPPGARGPQTVGHELCAIWLQPFLSGPTASSQRFSGDSPRWVGSS